MKKKILHLLKSPEYGGAQKVVLEIIEYWKEDFIFYYVSLEGAISEILKEKRISHFAIKEFHLREIAQLLEKLKPDIIHAHDFTASIYASVFSKKYAIISHIHYNANECKVWSIKSLLYLYSLKHIQKVLLVSDTIREEAIFKSNLEKKTIVVGNPIDKKKIKQLTEKQNIKAEYDVVFLGRLSKEKNPIKFITIIKECKRKFPKIRASLIGTGELEIECQEFIKKYKLDKNIDMLGFQENPYSILKKCKLLCMTSSVEGFGLSVVEANLIGIPALVAPVGGMKDYFEKDAPEFCYSIEEYVYKISILLKEENKYKKLKNRAIQRCKKLQDLEDYMQQLKKVYKELIK